MATKDKQYIVKKKVKRFNNILKKSSFLRILILTTVPILVISFLFYGAIISSTAKKQIEENIYYNMKDIVDQTKFYLDNQLYNIFDQFVSLENDYNLNNIRNQLQKENKIDYSVDNYVSLNKTLNQVIRKNNSTIESVYLNFNNDKLEMQGYATDLMDFQFSYYDWKNKYPENKYYWINTSTDYGLLGEGLVKKHNIGGIFFRLYESPNSDVHGIILFMIKEEFFKSILDNRRLSENGYLSVLTDEGDILFKDIKKEYQITSEDRVNILKNENNGEINLTGKFKQKHYIIYDKLNLTNWSLVAVIPQNDIFKYLYNIQHDSIALIVLLTLLIIFLLTIISKLIMRPISKLTTRVEQVQDGDLSAKFAIRSYKEVTILNNGLESMRVHIIKLLYRLKKEQTIIRETELSLLQSQIKPHFLYNTLYSAKQLCELNEVKQASHMLSALADFYRIGLSDGKTLITVEEELEHVKSYLFIQQMRYSDKFDYIIDCEDDIYKYLMPKLSLQPLVENAIYHGIKLNREKGYICIVANKVGDKVVLEVHDDGPGFEEERLKEINSQLSKKPGKEELDGMGLKNVNERIKLSFGNDYGIKIMSNPYEDTCVRLEIAIKESV